MERDDNVLLANLDACIDERIIYDENELNEQSFRCLVCNVSFNAPYNIRCHIRDQHVYKMFAQPIEPKKEFICDSCGMRLKTKKALKNHLLVHTDIKPHACTTCGKRFRQNSDRRIHERQHTGEVKKDMIVGVNELIINNTIFFVSETLSMPRVWKSVH